MNELILFGSTFASVFALGFQSQNVNNGHYIAAFLTSFLIGSSQAEPLNATRQPSASAGTPCSSSKVLQK